MNTKSTVGAQRQRPALWKTNWFSVDSHEHSVSSLSDGPRSPILGKASPVTFVTGSPVDKFTSRPMSAAARRGSFLFRTESDDAGSPHPGVGMTTSASAARLASALPYQLYETHTDDQMIVTPFAQILHRLQTARNSYSQLTNVAGTNYRRSSHITFDADPNPTVLSRVVFRDDSAREQATDILNELDWCLDQLERIQTHRSVSNMTTDKFKRLLSRELNNLAVSSKSGSQVSNYIHSTFLETDDEAETESQGTATGNDVSGNHDNRRCQATSLMSLISGVRRSRSASTSKLDVEPPTYGVEGVADSVLAEPMASLAQWGIDIFGLDSLVDGHTIVAVTYTVLKERDMLSKFQLSASTLLTYLSRVEDHYRNVPYHNHVHAADVTQSIHSLLSIPALQNVFTDLEELAVILAAAIHDVDHPGVTNQYLINTGSELAVMYNDESVLENHHLAVAFKLLQDEDCNVLKPFATKTRQRLRRIIIDLVLATDMSKHMSLLADLKTMVEAKKVTGSGVLVLESFTERMQVLQNMIHCADLSNPTKPLNIYRQWTDRIMQEFFEQGDIERELGLDISPMCDRHTATVEKSQVGFIDFIVHPLWETWADLVHPFCAELLDVLEDNRIWYSSRITHSSSSSSVADSARQAASPITDDGPSDQVDSQAEDGCQSTAVEEPDIDKEVQFVAKHHPDTVLSSLALQRTTSTPVPVANLPCQHPAMTSRRASLTEVTPNTAKLDAKNKLSLWKSEITLNGGPRQQRPAPAFFTTFHKPV